MSNVLQSTDEDKMQNNSYFQIHRHWWR